MPARKFSGPFATLCIVLVLLSGTAVMAGQLPLTDSCPLLTPSGSPTGYSIHVVPQDGEFPFWDTGVVSGTYRWLYQTDAFGSNSSIAVLVPYCTNPPIGIVLNDSLTSFSNILSAGNPTSDISGKTYFGIWTDHDNVVKLNYNAGVGQFAINTVEKNPVRQTSMQIKSGNIFYFCPGIKGPDCIDLPPPITTQAESYALGQTGCVMQITLLPNGNIANAQVFDPADPSNSNCPAGTSLTPELLTDTVVCTSGDPGSCMPLTYVQKNIMTKSGDHSTFCYYTTTGYRVCKTF